MTTTDPTADATSIEGRITAFVSRFGLLALRMFLATAYIYAGITKFADNEFLDTTKIDGAFRPLSLSGRIENAKDLHGPLVWLLNIVDSKLVIIGILVAISEIAVGLCLLLGIRQRTAALVGVLGQLSLVLTVTWASDPWYENVNLAMTFAFSALVAAKVPVWNLGTWLGSRRANASTTNTTATGIPAMLGAKTRRDILNGAVLGAGLAAGTAVLAGAARVVGQSKAPAHVVEQFKAPARETAAAAAPTTTPTPTPTSTSGANVIATLDEVKAANVFTFSDTNAKKSGFVVLDDSGAPKAISSICTHSGCKVKFNENASAYACPCHGSQFAMKTGAVVRGPARKPLETFAISISSDGNISLA